LRGDTIIEMVWCGRGQEFFQAIFARRLCGEAKVIEWLLSQKRQAAKPEAPEGGGTSEKKDQ